MGKCGYVNKFWNFDEGKWVNDPRGATIDCEMTESDVLDLCRSVRVRNFRENHIDRYLF